MCRRCGEPDRRGSAHNRRRRRDRLLEKYGDGVSCPCFWGCGTVLTAATLEQDRLVHGGPYRLSNVVPSCGPCNKRRLYAEVPIPEGCIDGPVGDLTAEDVA